MGPPSSLPLSFQQSELCYFSLSTKTKLDSMASAITCNFPTWCASFHWTLNSERLSPRFFVFFVFELSALIHLHPQEWYIWKCSLPGSRNVCGDLVSVCAQPPSHWNWKPLRSADAQTLNLSFIHLTHILIRPFKPLQKRQLWSPNICFQMADFYPIFPSTPTNSLFHSPSCSWVAKETTGAQLSCVFLCEPEWCFLFRGTGGERNCSH